MNMSEIQNAGTIEVGQYTEVALNWFKSHPGA
jgi:hypothetical protein